jgi:hypothetical protein
LACHLVRYIGFEAAAAFVATLASGKLVAVATHSPDTYIIGYTD